MHTHPLVSVIIPCFNDHLFIGEAINSINTQDYGNIEIIVVDDGSDLKTKEVLLQLNQTNLTLITQENKGTSAARNNGIYKSKGDYILTLDADDYFESSFITKAVHVLENSEEIGLVTCWFNVFQGNKIVNKVIADGGNEVQLLFENNVMGSHSLFRKKCWIDINGYDENMRKGFEDWEFNISVAKSGWKIFVLEEYLFYYRMKMNSRNVEANSFYKYELRKYVYTKHKGLCVNNFEKMISSFLLEINILEKSKTDVKKSIDYRIGSAVLKPIRLLMKKII